MTLKGILTSIFIASDPDSLVSTRKAIVRVFDDGFEGDKHRGWFRKADTRATRYAKGTQIWNSRQISIVSEGELVLIAEDLNIDKVEPEWLGANICLKGIPSLSLLKPGTKLFIPNESNGQEVGLYITARNKPCIAPGKVIQSKYPDISGLATSFSKAANDRRGVVAIVEHPGIIRENSVVSVVIKD